MSAYIPKSKSDKWGTPPEVYDPLNKEFNFNHDPCPIDWKVGDADGLTTEWGTSTFCNPPYSATAKWIEKASKESKKGKTVVMLINAVTDTKAFHQYIYKKDNVEIRFVQGRIKFINPENKEKKAPNVKGSMIVVFKASPPPERIPHWNELKALSNADYDDYNDYEDEDEDTESGED